MHVDTGTGAVIVDRRERQARSRRTRRIALAAVGALVATVLGVGLAYGGSSGTIASGIRVNGIDVGGMSTGDALLALQQHARRMADTPVAFTAGGKRFTFTPRQLGVTTDWRAAVEQARRDGDGFGPVRGFRRLALRFSGREVTPAVSAYDAIVASAVKAVAASVDRPAVPALIELKGLVPEIVPGHPGRVLDQTAAAELMVASLAAIERRPVVRLPMRRQGVRITAASLAPVVEKLRTILSAPVQLRYGGGYTALTPRQLAAMIEVPAPGSRTVELGGPAAERILNHLSKLVDAPPKNATFTLGADGLPHVVPSVDGRTLDRAATGASILAAAESAATTRTGELVVQAAKPGRTTAQASAMGIKESVGSYETTYGGIANRLHNVRLVASLIDDHYIAPGATFSFNQTTGDRSASKGFLVAPVIINGELQNGLGGGVCQVSTTVFNAAYEAGLPITSRTNHALYISHYPLGRDATVDYPSTDLKFVNDTSHWLWIRAFIGDSSLRITLFGTSPGRKVESTTQPLHAIGAVPVVKVDDPTLPKGKQVVDTSVGYSPPLGTSVRRVVYDRAGKKLSDTVWYSSYVGQPKIVHVGTKPKPKPKPKPKAKPVATDSAGSIISLH